MMFKSVTLAAVLLASIGLCQGCDVSKIGTCTTTYSQNVDANDLDKTCSAVRTYISCLKGLDCGADLQEMLNVSLKPAEDQLDKECAGCALQFGLLTTVVALITALYMK